MGQAIGQSLPAAVGIAVSPLPIVAVVLMLVTARGRVNGLSFVAGWALGLAVVGAVVLSLASGAADPTDHGKPATWVSDVKLGLGICLLALAVHEWRGRPEGDKEAELPKWMDALDAFGPLKAAAAGAALSALNPKNLLLAVSGAATIAGIGIAGGDEAASWVVFVAIATVGVATPVVISFALGDRSQALLDSLRTWLVRNNAVIMATLLLIIGVKLIGDAISGFSA